MKRNILSIPVLAVVFVVGFVGVSRADIAQIKIYKEAYPDSKPKCIDCHAVALPKKDGEHELNDYGKKVMALADKPTAENYKKAGSIEDSKKK